jgi:hypothetical protein
MRLVVWLKWQYRYPWPYLVGGLLGLGLFNLALWLSQK